MRTIALAALVAAVAINPRPAAADSCVAAEVATSAMRTAELKTERAYDAALAKKKLEPAAGLDRLTWDKRPAGLEKVALGKEVTWNDGGVDRRVVLVTELDVACGRDEDDAALAVELAASKPAADRSSVLYRIRRRPKIRPRTLAVCGCAPAPREETPCDTGAKQVTLAIELRKGVTWGGPVEIVYAQPLVSLDWGHAKGDDRLSCPAGE